MSSALKILNIFSYKEQISRTNIWGHHFLFLNIIFAIFIGSAYVYAAPHTDSFISFFYLLITWLGQMSFLAFLVYLIIFFPLSFIGNYRLYRVLAVILAILCFTLLLVDVKLFLSARVHISTTVLGLMFADLDFKTGLNYNFLWIAIPIVITVEIAFAKLCTREIYRSSLRHNHFPTFIAVLLTLSFIGSHCIHIWADANRYESINILRPVFPAHYPMTAKSFLSNHGWLKTDALPGEDTSDIALRYPLETLNIGELIPRRNVIVIFLNGISYKDLSTTDSPFLTALKKNSQSFENYYLPYSKREQNEFAATYGVPIQYKKAFNAKNIAPAVLDEMHRQEFLVRIISDDKNVANTALTGFRGFNLAIAQDEKDVFDKANNYLDNISSERRFALSIALNGLTKKNLKYNERCEKLLKIDNLVANFFKKLEENNRLNNTLVIVTSSEGNPNLDDGSSIYNRLSQHVPFILSWPNGTLRGVSVEALASPFDIVPTFGAEVLGITNSGAVYSLGTNLKTPAERDFIISNRGDDLLLISKNNVTVYRNNGAAFIENGGQKLQVRPNLKNLIRAMQDLNRFKD